MTDTPSAPVLVIEHDPGVRALLGRMLSRWGYSPLLAASEAEGLRIAADGKNVALVLSDFLPGPDEPTAHDQLKRRSDGSRPPPFLCTFGTPAGTPDGVVTLQRPFDIVELREAIRRLLEAD